MTRKSKPKPSRLELRRLETRDASVLYQALEASREALKKRLRWAADATLDACREFIASRGPLGLFELKTGELVGAAELKTDSAEKGPAELSGWVRSDRLDRGYALEAGKLLEAEAFRRQGFHKLCARIDPGNRAARKVLRRLGFKYEGCLRKQSRLNGRWVDQECWGLLRDEWKP